MGISLTTLKNKVTELEAAVANRPNVAWGYVVARNNKIQFETTNLPLVVRMVWNNNSSEWSAQIGDTKFGPEADVATMFPSIVAEAQSQLNSQKTSADSGLTDLTVS